MSSNAIALHHTDNTSTLPGVIPFEEQRLLALAPALFTAEDARRLWSLAENLNDYIKGSKRTPPRTWAEQETRRIEATARALSAGPRVRRLLDKFLFLPSVVHQNLSEAERQQTRGMVRKAVNAFYRLGVSNLIPEERLEFLARWRAYNEHIRATGDSQPINLTTFHRWLSITIIRLDMIDDEILTDKEAEELYKVREIAIFCLSRQLLSQEDENIVRLTRKVLKELQATIWAVDEEKKQLRSCTFSPPFLRIHCHSITAIAKSATRITGLILMIDRLAIHG